MGLFQTPEGLARAGADHSDRVVSCGDELVESPVRRPRPLLLRLRGVGLPPLQPARQVRAAAGSGVECWERRIGKFGRPLLHGAPRPSRPGLFELRLDGVPGNSDLPWCSCAHTALEHIHPPKTGVCCFRYVAT
jgi:hypothetical protein